MTKIEAIIQVSKLESVKSSLHEIGVEGMTVLEARGHGRQKGHTEFYRGREYTVDLIPKIKVELVVADPMVEKVVQAISVAARTGNIGDGKIFLSRIDQVIRILNDERGEDALWTNESKDQGSTRHSPSHKNAAECVKFGPVRDCTSSLERNLSSEIRFTKVCPCRPGRIRAQLAFSNSDIDQLWTLTSSSHFCKSPSSAAFRVPDKKSFAHNRR